MRNKKTALTTAFLLHLKLASSVFAATYYVSPSGSDLNSCLVAQTILTPKATFASAWGCLSAGDTLIARNGVYNQNLTPPQGKAGSAGNPITVRAETFGGVTINGRAQLVQNSYLTFQGLKMVGPANNSVFTISSDDSAATASHHITLQEMALRCPLTGATVNDTACAEIAGGANNNLLEDTWIWGGGRYTLMLYGRDSNGNTSVTGADFNTIRRVVIRMGPNVSGSGQPQAGIALYYASSNTIENVIVVDSNPNSNSSNSAFYLTSHNTPPNVSDNRFFGVMALNINGAGATGFYLDVDNGGNSSRTRVVDSVFWDAQGEGMSFYNQIAGNSVNTIIDHVTSVNNGSNGYSNYTQGTSVRNSIFANNGGNGLKNGNTGNTNENYNDIFNNTGGARDGVTAGANSLAVNPQLLYPPRIESGSACDGQGEGGSDCGADMTKRYVNGVKTGTNLWPWPNENRIKQDMCTDSGITTGFCAAATLTKYVWEYAGNTIPGDIYGSPTAPSFTLHPQNKTVEEAQTASFSAAATGTPSPSYQWFKNGAVIAGATSANYTTPATTLADDQAKFFVRASNSAGTVDSSSATLTVTPWVPSAPNITQHPQNRSILLGQTTSFAVIATGSPTPTYQWFKNGAPIAGATASSYLTPTTILADHLSNFFVRVSNIAGTIDSSSATLTILTLAPTISQQPQNRSVLVGQTATFTVTATGLPSPVYQWFKNGTIIPGATSAGYTTAATVIGDDQAKFFVRVSNIAGTVDSSSATLTVALNPVPPTITQQPQNRSVVVGQTAAFSVAATGIPTPTYQWYRNGAIISGATSANYTTPVTVLPDNNVRYYARVSNNAGAVSSSTGTLTVTIQLNITTHPSEQETPESTPVTLMVSVTGSSPAYQWQRRVGGIFQNIGGATAASYTFTPIAADNGAQFRCLVSNTSEQITSNVARITVIQPGKAAGAPMRKVFNPARGEEADLICLTQPGEASAEVYDRTGARMAELRRSLAAQECLTWNGRHDGEVAASGVYFYKASGNNQNIKSKVVILK